MWQREKTAISSIAATICIAAAMIATSTSCGGSQTGRWSNFPRALPCRVVPLGSYEEDPWASFEHLPAALRVDEVLLTHLDGDRLRIEFDFTGPVPPLPKAIFANGGYVNAPGSTFFNVLVEPLGAGNKPLGEIEPALDVESPAFGQSWRADVSSLDHPERNALISADATGNTVKLVLDLAGQNSLLGQGSFTPKVSVMVFGTGAPTAANPQGSLITYESQECGSDAVAGQSPLPARSPGTRSRQPSLIPSPGEKSSADGAGQYVRTQSGKVRCWVNPREIPCEARDGFAQMQNADPAVTPEGNFRWIRAANIGVGDYKDLVLTYGQTYHLYGWTILPTRQGTRFTSDATGHGMFVSIENVYPF